MRKTLAVAARELRERWLLLPGGLALGFVPLVLPAFGVTKEAAVPTGLVIALLLGGLAAFVVGSSMLARDADDGRLAFLLGKPVSWPAVWAGKWIAAGLLAGASGLLAAIPWMALYPPVAAGGSWLRAMADAQGWAFSCALVVLIVGVANHVSSVFRSRSKWLVVDLTLLVAAVWGFLHYVAPIRGRMGPPSGWELTLWLAPLPLAFLLASAAQLAWGRTDLQRAHRALSITFWAVVLTALVAWGGGLRWLLWSRGPADVLVTFATRGSAESWAYVLGREPGGTLLQAFLIDLSTGRYLPLPGNELGDPFGLGVAFSSDGGSGAMLLANEAPRHTLLLFDLAEPVPRTRRVTLQSPAPFDRERSWSTLVALSPSGGSVVMADESGLSLYRLPSGQRVAEVRLPGRPRPYALRFLTEHRVRAWVLYKGGGPSTLGVADLSDDGASRVATAESLGAVVFPAAWPPMTPDASGARILTRDDAGLHLRDGATGELVATLVSGRPIASGSFLADGRAVAVHRVPAAGSPTGGLLLSVFGATGEKQREVPLERRGPALPMVGPEISPGRVVVSTFAESVVVDVNDGRPVEKLPRLRAPHLHWFRDVTLFSGTPRPVQLFVDGGGSLLRVDFATGERKTVAGPGAPEGERLPGF